MLHSVLSVQLVTAICEMANLRRELEKYTTAMLQLRRIAEERAVRPFYFDNYVLIQYFQQRQDEPSQSSSGYIVAMSQALVRLELLKQICHRRRQIIVYLLLCLCFVVYRRDAAASLSWTERSMHFVYPGMRMWRRMTLPLIERFPRLTEWHDETCLMENPFFQIEDRSCNQCAGVQSVLDLSDGNTPTPADLVPFIFKTTNQKPIQLADFYAVYASNHEVFQRDAYRVQSTSPEINNLHDLFTQFNHSSEDAQKPLATGAHNSHNLWRCNRMLPARLLRRLFARPETHLPATGIALERFMAVDAQQAAAYRLPDTECANVFVQQALGARFVILRPTSECRHKCRTLSIRLPQSFVLSYNWWYWRPISAPDPVADTLSISFIGSYC